MKKSILYSSVISFMLFSNTGSLFSQDTESGQNQQEVTGGIIKYEHFIIFNFDIKPSGDARRDAYFTNLPKSRKKARILHFNSGQSLFEEDMEAETEVLDARTQAIIERLSYGQAPEPELIKVYLDLEKGENTELIELMTRLFLVESQPESHSWKFGAQQRKIQGYTCQEATKKEGEKTITAWFTPNIPFPFGPENYNGLPGLILAIDIDGQNIFLATSVDLSLPQNDIISKPADGKKTSKKAFESILEEKTKEFEEESARSNVNMQQDKKVRIQRE